MLSSILLFFDLISSSLFVALVVNPVLTSLYMRVGQTELKKPRVLRIVGILFSVAILSLLIFGLNWFGNLLLIVSIVLLVNLFFLFPATKKFQSNAIPRLENFYEKFSFLDNNNFLFYIICKQSFY